MPTLLAPANVREHIETDLVDAALQRLLDDADAEIVKRYGPHTGAVTEILDGGEEGLIFLTRPVASITSVTEQNGLTATVLAANDWRGWYGNRTIERLASGTNGADGWGERITVVYVPSDERAERKRVELQLVTLAIHYEAAQSVSVGDYSETGLSHDEERNALLAQLAPVVGVA